MFPNVPTIAEAGYPEGAIIPWYGFVVPRATPPSDIKAINTAINEVLATPDVRERLEKLGMEIPPLMTSEVMDRTIKSDAVRYADLIKSANIKVD